MRLPLRFVPFLLSLFVLLPLPAGAQIFPGQTGATLRQNLYNGYSPSASGSGASTLGYNSGRDVLYGTIYPQIQGGARTITCVYTGYTITLSGTGDPSSDAFNKGINTEHTWPQGQFNENEPMRSDLHHLFPTREDVNGARGSDPFAEIPDAQTTRWYRLATNQAAMPTSNLDEWSEDTGSSFEPREDHKGNVARSIFYFHTMYPTVNPSFFEGMKTTLRQWHTQDPADAYEVARSSAIAQHQGDPNPFIDDATLVDRAYFTTTTGPQTASVAFTASSASVAEGAAAALTVRLTTSDGLALGTAVSGSVALTGGTSSAADFTTTLPLSVAFAAGSASGATQALSLAAAADGTTEGSESATLTLGSLTGATAGSPSAFTLTVTEGGGGTGGTFVISQFQVAGGTADDEFVELLNVSSTSLDLQGYHLVYRSSSGTSDVSVHSFTTSRVVPAGGYLLVAHSGYDGSVARDVAFGPSVGLSGSAGGLALRNSAGDVADAVGYGGATNAFVEGTRPTAPGAHSSLARLSSGAQDTGNNATDFALVSPSVPRNTASPPLPVELSSFTAASDGGRTVLRWTTESETNNAGFTVEQHAGAAWRDLGFVAGRGTTSERSQYTHTVAGLAAGTYRFRLRQTDFDGTTSYSPTVEVVIGLDRALNVSVTGRTVRLSVREAQAVCLEAFDLLGRRVAVLLSADLSAGEVQDVHIEAGTLAAGTYIVRAVGTEGAMSRLLVLR